MTLKLSNVTFDCEDALVVASFWSAALGRPLATDPEPTSAFACIGNVEHEHERRDQLALLARPLEAHGEEQGPRRPGGHGRRSRDRPARRPRGHKDRGQGRVRRPMVDPAGPGGQRVLRGAGLIRRARDCPASCEGGTMSGDSDDGSGLASESTLGHSPGELERLIQQGRFVGDLTEHLLRLAGLGPGMRVLDVGCGTGDVCLLLAARLVGSDGAVIGVDMSAEAVTVARERTRRGGLANIDFVVQDAAELALDQPVDAIVGRLLLTHYAGPAPLVRRLLRNLRPGGVVVFQEPDLATLHAEPPCPLLEATIGRIAQTIALA